MRTYGLVGFPLEHSFSPDYFQQKFEKEGIADCRYRLFPLKNIDALAQFFGRNPDVAGLNVTSPYKMSVIPFLDSLTAVAEAVGAVNTIAVRSVGGKRHLVGHNTDVAGFSELLSSACPQLPESALVLGSGGASRAVRYALEKNGVRVQSVSRFFADNVLTYNDLSFDVIQKNRLIINATPLGMVPYLGAKPELPYEALSSQHTLIDLIYNPEKTPFLKAGEERGASICNGLTMLHAQAEASWRFWLSEPSA
ncbi:MAG: shikimate dehydrogenase [Bacteroidales bacterium]|nr:shikimate dehydrogenase [Bacteroidales bacterium]